MLAAAPVEVVGEGVLGQLVLGLHLQERGVLVVVGLDLILVLPDPVFALVTRFYVT